MNNDNLFSQQGCPAKIKISKFRYMNNDNLFSQQGCPAKMEDGRFISNFENARRINTNLRRQLNFKDSYDYRLYLQSNGEKIMDEEYSNLRKNYSCIYRCDKK